jgi:hypothetical protein
MARGAGNGATARSRTRPDADSLRSMEREPRHGRSARDARLASAIGYCVDAPEGHLGSVQGIPHAGQPPRPLVLVVSDGKAVRFVSLRRVAAVLPNEQRIVLRPAQLAPLPLERTEPTRRAA